MYIFSVGPLADPQALSDEFRKQYEVIEKMCADYTARLRSNNVCKFFVYSFKS